MPSVELVGVTKRFGRKTALDNVSLRVEDGEYAVVLGPTGAGKTTLLRIVAGVLKPDAGEVRIGEAVVNDVPPDERGVALFFQNFALFPHMTVLDNVAYGPRMRGLPEQDCIRIAREMLDLVHLLERADSMPHELSGGMQQRVALARALATGANLLLLDEPLSQLDARIGEELRYELRRFAKDLGLTAIHVTNDVDEAMAVADRIVVLKRGSVVQVGSPEEVYLKPKTPFVASFVGEATVFEAVVKAVDDERVHVEAMGVEITAHAQGFSEGDLVVAAIRPESVRLLREAEPALANRLEVAVERISFIGGMLRVECGVVGTDLKLLSLVPDEEDVELAEGEKLFASFSPEEVSIYPYPSEGLFRELSLE